MIDHQSSAGSQLNPNGITKALTENPKTDLKDRIRNFTVIYIGLTLLDIFMLLHDLLSSDKNQLLLFILISTKFLTLLLVTALLVLVFNQIITRYRRELLYFAHSLIILSLVLFRYNMLAFFSDKPEEASHSPLPMFLFILAAAKYVLFTKFWPFLLINFALLSTYSVTCLLVDSNESFIYETILGSGFILYQSWGYFLLSKQIKTSRKVYTRRSIKSSRVSMESNPVTHVERTMTKIVNSLDIMQQLHRKIPDKEDIMHIVDTLQSAMDYLGDNSVHNNIDEMTTNLDLEDKIHFSETYCSNQ